MSENNPVVRPPERFVSAKTTAPIPIRHPAIRDALVQLSLDPSIRSIGYLESAIVASEQIDLDAIVLHGESGRVLLDIVPARPIRDLEEEGLALIALGELDLPTLVITSEDLRREPRYTNCRSVWRYNKHHVPLEIRIRILQVLLEQQSIELAQLLQNIRADSVGSRAIMSLACSDLLELDLSSQPLGPRTIVRCRASHRSD
jgi:hypothetical protein